MSEDSKIIRSLKYKAFVDDISTDSYDIEELDKNINSLISDDIELSEIERDIKPADFIMSGITGDDTIPSIEDYKEEQIRKVEEARLQEIEERERMKIIEEPIDLTDKEEEYYEPIYERRVSFRRTYGTTKSRLKDIDKYTTIGLLIVFAICVIMMTIITLTN